MSNWCLLPTFKTVAEDFIYRLQKYCTITVDYKSEEECAICTLRLCEIDGCKIEDHEEPVRLHCGHVIGSDCAGQWFMLSQQCPMCRAVLLEVPRVYGP